MECRCSMANMPEISFSFSQNLKTLFSETRKFAQLEALQIFLYFIENVDEQDVRIKWELGKNKNTYECKVTRSEHGLPGNLVSKDIQKELLFSLLSEYKG